MQRNLFNTIKENFIKVITSRLFVLVIILVSLGSILIHRVFELQIVNGQTYLDNFQLKIQKERNIYSTRGNIYDRNGIQLAKNSKTFQAVMIKENAKDYKKTLENFLKIIPLDEEETERIKTELKFKRAFKPVRLKDNLTQEEMITKIVKSFCITNFHYIWALFIKFYACLSIVITQNNV